ncbi:MAG: 4Fe-4S dicluster domain-containing protein [Rhodospirillaceae bacterium]|nr:4Fe-4S dicluster domain-containing protein [Rhodospirillaceae bacterium]
MTGFGDVAQRLAGNTYVVDEESHIEVDQELARKTGTGRLLVRVCPAQVYSENEDGTIAVLFAACLECGTCLALAASGSLKWHYPNGGFGISYREG